MALRTDSCDTVPAPLTNKFSLGFARIILVPISQQSPHDMSPERRRQRDERHGLITVRQNRGLDMRLQLPEILRGCHMVIRVTRQIVVQGVGDRSIAVPTMMRLHRVIFDAHKAKVLRSEERRVGKEERYGW